MEDDRYDLNELSNRAGVSPRTVRYYIQLGLLPAPGSGPGVRYGRGHLDRLRLIRLLQSQHLPLHVIADTLTTLDDDGVRASVDEAEKQTPSPKNSAAEYIQSVLARELGATPPLTRDSTTFASARKAVITDPLSPMLRRDNWERIAVTADVELHVRRPLSREMNRRIERLLAVARQILTDQPTAGEEK